jgi:hypothetical protein
MTLEFPCPWCGADTKVRGAEASSWRFRLPCDLCSREMVVTWDGGLAVARAHAHAPASAMRRSDDETVRIRTKKTA